jgi:hypothetical protein
MLACARAEINKWRIAGQPAKQIGNVLYGVIVSFGEGNRFVWPIVKKFLSGHSAATNTAIKDVDKNISIITPRNISTLFAQLAKINGLGSKSYSSKVLRCLCDIHVVLDNLIESELGERIYLDFRQKCYDIGKATRPPCSPADVEGGLFVWLQILNPKQRRRRWKRWQASISIKCNIQIEDVEVQKPNVSTSTGRNCIWLEEGPKAFLKIVSECCGKHGRNDGMICLNHNRPHIWLKNNGASRRYLIGEILIARGSFTAEPGYIKAPAGVPNCGVGGVNYQGGVPFESADDAVKYLKRYFDVLACRGNSIYDQPRINKL